ncbi:MAG: hypothetical protein AB1758_22200, partial [Candidatus Eremiobacterota bacterium]
RSGCSMRKTVFLMLAFLAFLGPAWARDEIVPTPPEFVLDKQLPGEDPYWIYRPTFSPDGKLVAGFMSSSRILTVWDVKTGQVLKQIGPEVHLYPDSLDGLEFSLDGSQLLTLRSSHPLRFIDWKNGKVVREIALNADPRKIMDYTFSPDMGLLAVGTSKGIHLWDVKKGVKLKEFVTQVPVCAVDYLEYTPPKAARVRLLAYAKPLMPPDQVFKKVAGIINIDSGAITPLLDDVPEDKKIHGKMTFFRVRFEWGGSYLLIAYWTIPPQADVKAGVFLLDPSTGKYYANHDLGQLTVSYDPVYLGKPFWGFEVATANMLGDPYLTSAQFLVPTRKEGFKVLDTIPESTLAVQSLSINRGRSMAAVCVKKGPMDSSKLYLYKLVPKKLP